MPTQDTPSSARPADSPVAPPVAPRRAHTHDEHGILRDDPYWWMGTDSPELTAHLAAERAFYDLSTTHLDASKAALWQTIQARVSADEQSAPSQSLRCSYYMRLAMRRDYPQFCREQNSVADGTARGPQVLLDHEELLTDSGYLDVGVCLVSPDENLLAYSVDVDGDEVFEMRFRDLRTGRDLPDRIPRTYYGGAWSADSTQFFYTVHDQAYRPFEVRRHTLGSPGPDELILTEPDERFELDLTATRSGAWIVIESSSNTTTECWLLPTAPAASAPRSAGGRREGIRYAVDHRREQNDLLVVTDDDAVESRLMLAPVPEADGQDASSWRPVRPYSPDTHILAVDAFADGVVLTIRAGGEQRLLLLAHDDLGGAGLEVRPMVECGSLALDQTPLYAPAGVVVRDEGWTSPPVWSHLDLVTGRRSLIHQIDAGPHDPDSYVAQRHEFPSADGTEIPAVIVRHCDVELGPNTPVLIYAYGSYGAVDDPTWDPALVALLDAGVVWVHAHPRGGGERGQAWYLDGKLARKQHTFDDLIAVADGLANAGLVDPSRIVTRGLSAGGLLQGAVFSQRPDRWRAVVSEVPFVDVVTTMFDEATPLTITERDEWGDPRVKEQFDWMLAYSPYDNMPPAGTRPDLLVTGAWHDPRVPVREPAKWVAALRHSDPEWSPRCLFRVETGAGAHVGPSGRLGHLHYEAEIYAWVLDRMGQMGHPTP